MGGGTRDEGVASIATPSAHAASSAEPDAGPVRIRLDYTQQDVNRLWDVWTRRAIRATATVCGPW
ncbi:hypothetical protein [Streptomyces sp. NBC_01239]|uniref:hypothetical protein n=1 Tax=Streptomyces sp. NBC_01239 TaxID=2903792 RepID=UPI00225C11F6|nr:hypothetical protein [Streptomyces sp. NBC_01239]